MNNKQLILAFLVIHIIFSFTDCSHMILDQPSDNLNVSPSTHPTQETHPLNNTPTDSTVNQPTDNLSSEDLDAIRSYVQYTDNGIKLIRCTNDFISGYLEYTITGYKTVNDISSLTNPQDGFLYESCLILDENNRWKELNKPACINEDGTLTEGYSIVLFDITVKNFEAAKEIEKPGLYNDPYLFRADALLWLVDLRYKGMHNYAARSIDYFSAKGSYPEHECCYRIEAGESIDFTIGFIVSAEKFGGTLNWSKLRACNTSGHEDSVFIELTPGGD